MKNTRNSRSKTLSIIIACLAFVMLGAAAVPEPPNYFQEYQEVLAKHQPLEQTFDDNSIRFFAVFADLTADSFISDLTELYADDVYFNDTLFATSSKPELLEYFKTTQKRLSQGGTKPIFVFNQGNHYYFKWQMDITFSIAGFTISSETIGITHAIFNDEGKVVMHQDFWDNKTGIFEKLPLFKQLYWLTN